MPSNPYEDYYLAQAGNGIPSIYSGNLHMKGHGLGSFLKGALRAVFPLFKTAGRAILGAAGTAGMNVLHDVATGRNDFRDSVKSHLGEMEHNLTDSLKRKVDQIQSGSGVATKRAKIAPLQTGNGYKSRKTAPKPQSKRTPRAVRTRLLKSDIFTT